MPNLEQIKTQPDPFEAFNISQAMRVGDLVFTSGQAAIDSTGQLVGVDDFEAQAQQTFENLKAVLEAAGSGLDHVIKVTIFLTDMAYFARIVSLREQWFSTPYPADTLIEVKGLALPELMIEIEAVAAVT